MDKTVAYIKGYANGRRLTETIKALNAAEVLHDGQFRKSGEPYLIHPVMVAAELIALQMDEEDEDIMIATALLHDVLEDCKISTNLLVIDYNIDSEVVHYVKDLSKGAIETTEQYYTKLRDVDVATMVKLADRCHNLTTMVGAFSKEKIVDYIEETQQYVIPLCKYARRHYPEYVNQIYVLKYHIQSICETTLGLLTTIPEECERIH